jgi:L-histidine N-alpha-methyltransferase
MRLRSAIEQTVLLRAMGLSVRFGAGEEMRTEISAKFRREGIARELAAAGLDLRSWWTDSQARFGVSLSVPV